MDFTYSDEQKLIREAAREFAEREILPNIRENDREGRFDRELARKLGHIGFLGAPVAKEYGGRGLDYVSYGLIAEEIGRADSSARTVVSVVTSLVGGPIEKWGTIASDSTRSRRSTNPCGTSSTSRAEMSRRAGATAKKNSGRSGRRTP